jgi:DNA-binding CsgD family transcriptional regulator
VVVHVEREIRLDRDLEVRTVLLVADADDGLAGALHPDERYVDPGAGALCELSPGGCRLHELTPSGTETGECDVVIAGFGSHPRVALVGTRAGAGGTRAETLGPPGHPGNAVFARFAATKSRCRVGRREAAMKLLGRRAECEVLDGVVADALDGRSRVVVLRGDAGSGKSALLAYVSEQVPGWRVATAVAIESELELAYSGLHQLCAPMLDRLDRLPVPQRDALATVFGLSIGPAPDRFLVGLATLTLLADAADERPLLCILDDMQWLDEASTQILGFVARRLLAERIALVGAARRGIGDEVFAGLPSLPVDRLGEADARALLQENLPAPFDTAVYEQILVESHGNPLALIELPRTWSTAEVAGGFGLPGSQPVTSRIEQSYAKRLLSLPAETQLLVLAAAAEPRGDLVLLQQAAGILGLPIEAATPAVDAGLLEIGGRVEFAHPVVRSAAYHSATGDDRQRVHAALADATDPERDPDRRAWHRARATPWPDEDVATELERSAGRAQARGGLSAAAAFLERAAALSPDPAHRARRTLEAAEAKQIAGAPQAATALLAAATGGPLDELGRARARRLEGEIALGQRRPLEAARALLDAAARLESIDPALARETYLETLRAGTIGGRLGGDLMRRAAEATRNAPSSGKPARPVDLLLDGLAVRFTDGCTDGAPLLRRALDALRDEPDGLEHDIRWPGFATRVALDLFDDETCHAFAVRGVEVAREKGALGVLPLALAYLATLKSFEGELDAAEVLVEESNRIVDATGAARIALGALTLAGFRGDEAAVSALVESVEPVATDRGEGTVLSFVEYARAIVDIGLGRYEEALPAALSVSTQDELPVSTRSLPEVVEAAARSGRPDVAGEALGRLTERTRAAATNLALGLEARSRALLSEGAVTEELYQEAIERLGGSRFAPDHARARLLYGEWLRREGRRVDAREELRSAHDMLLAIGMEAFAERARRELVATGETARKRVPETRDDLTSQEAQIAQLARQGYSNPEIGAQLFLSPRTVEWHLRKVFAKLAISSRKELEVALYSKPRRPQLA